MRFSPLVVAVSLAAMSAPVFAQDTTVESPPWAVLGLDRSVDWLNDPEHWIDARRPKRSIDAEIDREGMIDNAIRRAKAQDRLVFWYIPRIVESSSRGRQMYRAPVLDIYAQQGLFNDPDLAALLESRFVSARIACDDALAERFGIRPLEVIEPAYLVLDGDGHVVHMCERLRTFDPVWLRAQLRLCLEKAGDPGRPVAPEDAARLLREGRDEMAQTALEAMPAGARRSYLEAVAARLMRNGDEARAALKRAVDFGGLPQGDLAAEQNLLAMLESRLEDVVIPSEPLAGSRGAEAHYLGALAAYETGDNQRAQDTFAVVAANFPDSVFGARALANLKRGKDQRPYGGAFTGFERQRWHDEGAYRELHNDTRHWNKDRDFDAICVAAVDQLLRLQRDNGGFQDSRYAYWPSPEITPNAWVAISAIAAGALHAHREAPGVDTARVDDALTRADDYLFDPKNMNRGANEDVYADTYRIHYLVRRIRAADSTEASRYRAQLNQIIREAAERQREGGFFAHEYSNAFCTAAMLQALVEAEKVDGDVPAELKSRAVAAILSARTDAGGFAYSGTAERRQSSVKDSSARMPLCESMLFAHGVSDDDRLLGAFQAFEDHYDRIENVRRNDFHSDGELGGFFYFHSLYHTSVAAQYLGGDRQREVAEMVLNTLKDTGEFDGAFVDSHEIGRSYGTGMALLVLDLAQAMLQQD
ncbi:MAG: hypothetical protein AAF196_05550 [Planctomycetota bacterium]